MNFDQCIKIVGIIEGGYSTDRNDRGNWSTGIVGKGIFLGTKYGISGMKYPHLDIKHLTKEQAKNLFKVDVWDTCRIDDLPEGIRLYTFDSCVNHGNAGGIRLLQRAIGGISVDGVIGRQTVGMAHKATPWTFAVARSDYYAEIVQNGFNDKNDIEQLKGWLRRNLSILKYSLS